MNFTNFGFKSFINESINKLGFKEPTPVQKEAIPLLKKHRNLIVKAPTGTGKSHAFLLPLINNLNSQKPQEIQLIIVVPTQELGKQLFDNARFLIENTNFKVELHVKGNNNKIAPDNKPTIIIGTPQRLKFLYENQDRNLTKATALVIDEVDMIFEYGFIQDLDFLINKMRSDIQIAFFSATINQNLLQYLKKYTKNSFWIEIKEPPKKLVKHYLVDLSSDDYWPILKALIENLNPYLALIFVNDKTEITKIKTKLEQLNIGSIGELHSNLDSRTRNQMLKRIQKGDFKYVVASDLAARGLDIAGVSHVISLGLPKNLNFYWHRSGRTGRNNNSGESYLLINNDNDRKNLKKLQKKETIFIPLKLDIHKNLFVTKKTTTRKTSQSKKNNQELNQLIGSFAKDKVKPNYKKKQKVAVEKLIKQNRRKEIIVLMRKNKKNNYKKRRALIFDK